MSLQDLCLAWISREAQQHNLHAYFIVQVAAYSDESPTIIISLLVWWESTHLPSKKGCLADTLLLTSSTCSCVLTITDVTSCTGIRHVHSCIYAWQVLRGEASGMTTPARDGRPTVADTHHRCLNPLSCLPDCLDPSLVCHPQWQSRNHRSPQSLSQTAPLPPPP